MSGKLNQTLSSPSSSGHGVSSPQQRPWLWQKLVPRVQRCRGRPSCVLGGCCVLEKLSNIQSSVECSVGDWRINLLRAVHMVETWLVKVQREVSPLKTLQRPLVWCFALATCDVWLAGVEELPPLRREQHQENRTPRDGLLQGRHMEVVI